MSHEVKSFHMSFLEILLIKACDKIYYSTRWVREFEVIQLTRYSE